MTGRHIHKISNVALVFTNFFLDNIPRPPRHILPPILKNISHICPNFGKIARYVSKIQDIFLEFPFVSKQWSKFGIYEIDTALAALKCSPHIRLRR